MFALWSERHQRYAARTRLETSNLTQNSGFAGCSFLDDTSRRWAVHHWPIDRESPEQIGSRAWTVFDSQAAAMKAYRVPYADGT